MLWHLVAEISRFKFDGYRVIRIGASDLKLLWGGVHAYTYMTDPLALNVLACQ